MPELVIDGDRRLVVAGPFRLAFAWVGDRWTHSLENWVRGEDKYRVLAVAVESDSERDDPSRVVSPAYQDLHFQADESKAMAMLVGQSGPHHFSAVFEVEEKASDEILIRVDVADRCRAGIEALGSTYTVDATSGDLVDASPACIAWDIGANRLTFAAEQGGPTHLAWSEAGRCATRVQALADLSSADQTRRFRYLWHWHGDVRR